MFGTYKEEDVKILLKDITGLVEPLDTKQREKAIQSGKHYCEMLPIEYEPSAEYQRAFEDALHRYSGLTANAVAAVAQKIWKIKGENVVLVSLARAGTPVGILIKRYIKLKYGKDVAHYSVSIIRGRGIDRNAMKRILSEHSERDLQFIDGWTGKGAIQNELNKAMKDYENVDPGLAVLSDPANIAGICGTKEDFLIASSCLNSTVSGLLSRTFLREDIIGHNDFHGAVFYKNLISKDVTYEFIETVQKDFPMDDVSDGSSDDRKGNAPGEVERIAREFGVKDINLIKPGIGEATRVLLRRLPRKMLVHSLSDEEHLGHLYRLAYEKGVDVIEYPLRNYKACGIIKTMADT